MEVEFKRVTASEKALLLEMMAPFYEHEGITSSLPRATTALDQVFRDERLGKIWFLTQNGASNPIGYVVILNHYSLEYGGTTVIIDELYVEPKFRGQGLGDKIISFLEQELRTNGLKVLYLEVSHENQIAQKLYRKHGFTDQKRFLLTKVL